MTSESSKTAVPEPGENPGFDEFVDEQLSWHGDVLDEERAAMWEMATDGCEPDLDPGACVADWWAERVRELRAELWEQYAGCRGDEPWEALNRLTEEADALREQVAGKDGLIRHLTDQLRKAKSEQEATEAELYATRDALAVERELTGYLREERRCPECRGRMFP